jgi:hypothetical protein
MLRNFLYNRAETWAPKLRSFFEKRGIAVEEVTASGATLRFNEESLTKAIKTTAVLSVVETAVTLAVGVVIGLAAAKLF